jgi:ADP-heptose:LPS heptosyltransferase
MKILLSTHRHLGDTVALTAALRNAKTALPDVLFDYDGSYRDVFANNPNITPFDHCDSDVTSIKVTYSPFSQRRGDGGNLCQGYSKCLALALQSLTGVLVPMSQFTPVINLTEEEQVQYRDLERYCVINANCQKCSEVKRYPYWQQIVDACPDMKFVQVGGNEKRDVTMNLRNVVDLRGTTTVRQLFSLVANAKYVVSPSSAVIHIAAAFKNVNAYCLVGAREPTALTKYANVGHFCSTCGRYFSSFGCMNFYTHGIHKTCINIKNINDYNYASCMCDINPKEVASCLV